MNALTSSSVNEDCMGISIVRFVILAAASSPRERQLGALANANSFWNYQFNLSDRHVIRGDFPAHAW